MTNRAKVFGSSHSVTKVGNSLSHFDLPECSMQIFQFMLKLKTRVVNAGYGVDLEQCMVIHAGI